jgi:hypothetical protein
MAPTDPTTKPQRPGARAVAEGRERRGFRFRAYPTPEQRDQLYQIQHGLRRCWNWLCARAEDTREANASWAIREGLAGPRPVRPDAGPDAKPTERDWEAWKAAMRDWRKAVAEATKGRELCAHRNMLDYQEHFYDPGRDGSRRSKHERLHDYQVFERALDWGGELGPLPQSAYLQALCKDHKAALSATTRGQRPPKFRRRDDDMSVRVCSGAPLVLEAGGPRPNCPNGKPGWLNARFTLPGVGRIWCHIAAEQLARLEGEQYRIEGVSLTREADGWYAAIRQDVEPTVMPEFKPGTACGIDGGLVELFALVGSDEHALFVDNPRKGFSLRKLHAQDTEAMPGDWAKSFREALRKCGKASNVVVNPAFEDQIIAVLGGQAESKLPMRYEEFIALRKAAGLPVSRMQCRAARNVREIVRRELFRTIDAQGYEFIFIEKLDARIGQQGLAHVSAMRCVARMLQARYGARVIEVDPYLSSHQCSRCGSVGERSWSAMPDRRGQCVACGHAEHSDTNAARVVLRRGLGQLDIPPREPERCPDDGERSIGSGEAGSGVREAEDKPSHRARKRNRSRSAAQSTENATV